MPPGRLGFGGRLCIHPAQLGPVRGRIRTQRGRQSPGRDGSSAPAIRPRGSMIRWSTAPCSSGPGVILRRADENRMSSLPLDGITVVSLEQAVAAPFATRQLADLGARVIKVERDIG